MLSPRNLLLNLFLISASAVAAQSSFEIIPLGVKGGGDESNLSSYALTIPGSDKYVCFDAGTLNYGAQVAVSKGLLKTSPDTFIKKNIKGYLISHAHLDHVAGMIINSPDDASKNIYGLGSTIQVLRDYYFTWKSWANFGNDGDHPTGKYHYVALEPAVERTIDSTSLQVTAFSLSHGGNYESAAFLVRSNASYILYLGDTGADLIEKSTKLLDLWKVAGPLIAQHKLKAIFIEVSFANDQPNAKLFGHLTPTLLMGELKTLAGLGGSLADFPIVITHRKPSGDREERIQRELESQNSLRVKLIFPQQGEKLTF